LIADSIAIDELLLILKIGFLVLLYLFIWRIVRTASRDIVSTPQESFVLTPGQAAAAGLGPGRLVVVASPILPPGEQHPLDSAPLTIGRSAQNDIELHGDEYASAAHARFEARRDGAWVEDAGSTNGTYVNGVKIERARKLAPGDVVRVGETELRYER
jgi:pSer/pThr/pTyr-binding forkhead associated (FHA) protein